MIMRGLQSSFPRPITTGSDVCTINVFDIAGFVNYLERFGMGLEGAVKYSMNDEPIEIASEGRDDVVLFIYNKTPRHGVLELYEMAHPKNLPDIVQRFIDEVENHVRS